MCKLKFILKIRFGSPNTSEHYATLEVMAECRIGHFVESQAVSVRKTSCKFGESIDVNRQ